MDSYANLGSYALLIFEQTISDLSKSLTLSHIDFSIDFSQAKLSAKISTVSFSNNPLLKKIHVCSEKHTRKIRFYSNTLLQPNTSSFHNLSYIIITYNNTVDVNSGPYTSYDL